MQVILEDARLRHLFHQGYELLRVHIHVHTRIIHLLYIYIRYNKQKRNIKMIAMKRLIQNSYCIFFLKIQLKRNILRFP